jgi:hypothetical protein
MDVMGREFAYFGQDEADNLNQIVLLLGEYTPGFGAAPQSTYDTLARSFLLPEP